MSSFRRVTAFAPLIPVCLFLWSCASTAPRDASTQRSGSVGARRGNAAADAREQERLIARTLILVGLRTASHEEARWLGHMDATIAQQDPSTTTELERRMRSMLAADFTDEERLLVLAQGEVHFAFDLARAGRFADAAMAARLVLSKEGLSPQLHRWALSAWMVSHALSLTVPPVDFHGLQRMHCDEICALPGWRLVSLEDGGTLSQDGYYNRLLTNLQFDLAGHARPAWLLALLQPARPALATTSVEPSSSAGKSPPSARESARESPLETVARLLQTRRWDEAASRGDEALAQRAKAPREAPSTRKGPPPAQGCDGLKILTLSAKANAARYSQRRDTFLVLQDWLVGELEQGPCVAADLGMEAEEFQAFTTDARLWLARLLWEAGRDAEAEKWATRAALDASNAGDWGLFLESAQVLVGRVQFESRPPKESLATLESLIDRYTGPEDEDFTVWSSLRKGLLEFLAQDWPAAEAAFDRLLALDADAATRAQAWYWKARTQSNAGHTAQARESLRQAGEEDPLSYYDVLAGQLLGSESGLASTSSRSPFERPWREIQERWIRMRVGRPFALFRPELWFGGADSPGSVLQNPASSSASSSPREQASPLSLDTARRQAAEETQRQRRRAFENAVSSSLLLATSLRAGLGVENFEQFTTHLRDSGTLFARLLRSEALWAKQSYTTFYGDGQNHFPSAVRIAWLLHVLGDYRNAIPFVALFKNDLLDEEEDLAFLYFIFYPKPFVGPYTEAARTCGVDVDLLYAVSRQESLFQPQAVSPAGAVGLMQLLPSTAERVLRGLPGRPPGRLTREALMDPATNTLAGACYLRDLLTRYKGNMTHAVAAYNAGEATVDTWLARRGKSTDVPYFVEWIPYQETREYVQKVMRNHYNLKWIYGPR